MLSLPFWDNDIDFIIVFNLQVYFIVLQRNRCELSTNNSDISFGMRYKCMLNIISFRAYAGCTK